jgi:signal transduction histidine kinase
VTTQENVCTLLQEIGLPAVEVEARSAEVVGSNELFSSLFNGGVLLDPRLWFLDGVLPHLNTEDKTRWKSALAHQASAQFHISFNSADGREFEFEMRSFALLGGKKSDHSIFCIFIPLDGPILKRVFDEQLSLGRELERGRIRNELHQDVSQKLLGAAFGCKLLAGKVTKLNEALGKEASDLAELVNEAVVELQKLVQSSGN